MAFDDKSRSIWAKASIFAVIGMIATTTLVAVVLLLFNTLDYSNSISYLLISLLSLALLAPLVITLHRAAYRGGGIVLSVVFLAMWLGFLVLICGNSLGWFAYEKVFPTIMLLFLMGIPAAVGMMCSTRPWGRTFAWSLLAVSTLCGAASILGNWLSDYHNEFMHNLMVCGIWSFVHLGCGTVLLINAGRGDRRYFRWAGVLIACGGCVIQNLIIWHEYKGAVSLLHTAGPVCLIATATLGFVNLLLMTRHRGPVRWLKWITIVLFSITGIGMILFLLMAAHLVDYSMLDGDSMNWVGRCTAAVFMLASGFLLTMLCLRTLGRLTLKSTALPALQRIKLHCPNCGREQEMGLNGSCTGCFLRFKIVLAEPRCPRCEHLLINLTSDRCPECGHTIARTTV